MVAGRRMRTGKVKKSGRTVNIKELSTGREKRILNVRSFER